MVENINFLLVPQMLFKLTAIYMMAMPSLYPVMVLTPGVLAFIAVNLTCTLLDSITPDYIFPLYWFVKLELSKKIMGGTRGSAIPYIVMNDLTKFEFVYNAAAFSKYMPVFKSLTEAIHSNEFEIENLAMIRDTLLPKLMNGELDVSDLDL